MYAYPTRREDSPPEDLGGSSEQEDGSHEGRPTIHRRMVLILRGMHLNPFRWVSDYARGRAAVDEAIQLGGALMLDRFWNSKFALVGTLALYAALGWMVAMEVTK